MTGLEAKLAEALRVLRLLYEWNVNEVDQFGGVLPDNEIIEAVKAVLGETE